TIRVPVDASRLGYLITAISAEFAAAVARPVDLSERERAWVAAAVRDLRDHKGKSLFAVGAHLPAAIQAQAAIVNERLGNVGQTLWYSDPVGYVANDVGTLADLARDIGTGAVEALIVLDSNPAFHAPGALGFADLLARVAQSIHVGLYRDETAVLCGWHLPLTHALESWSDARAVDGTVTIIQPVVAPFYSVRTVHQVMEMLLGAVDPAADAPVRTTWQDKFGTDFEQRWRRA